MILSFIVLLQVPAQPQPLAPRREITDPGTIATNQRVTPAGVQSVFTAPWSAARFGRPGEVRATIHGAARPLARPDNAMLGSAAFDGRAGVQGIAIDPVTGRTLVTRVRPVTGSIAMPCTPARPSKAALPSIALSGLASGRAAPWMVARTSPGRPNRAADHGAVNTLCTPAGVTR